MLSVLLPIKVTDDWDGVGHGTREAVGSPGQEKSIEAVLEEREPNALLCWAVWLHSLAADTVTHSKISPSLPLAALAAKAKSTRAHQEL